MYNQNQLDSVVGRPKDAFIEQIKLHGDSIQKNDFGYDCIPTNIPVTVTAYLSKLQKFQWDTTISTLSSTSSTIKVSESILPLASVEQADSHTLQVVLEPADQTFEHTDVIVSFSPLSNDKGVSPIQARSITLRYNTPPAVPLGVVSDAEGKLRLSNLEPWDIVTDTGDKNKDGYIFWAWPQGMTTAAGGDQRHPDCISAFVLNGRAYTPIECGTGIVLESDDGKAYDVFRLYVGKKSLVELYAKDIESIRSPSLLSGIEFFKLSLNVTGGSFEGLEEQSVVLHYENGTECNLSDLPVPSMEGYVFAGWSHGDTDMPLEFPLVIAEDMELSALWQTPATVGEVRDLQGLFNLDEGVIVVTWNHPYVHDAVALNVVFQGEDMERMESVGIDVGEILFDGIEGDTGEYLITVHVVDSAGNESSGFSTRVSSNTEFYDEVGNLQALVLSERIDFSWTSPPKNDISHILLICYGSEGEVLGDSHVIDKDARFSSIFIEEKWPSLFGFHTVDQDGVLSEGMSMYTLDLELDGNLDAIDGRLVVPASSSLDLLDIPERDGFVFGGWYADADFEEPYDTAVPILGNSCLFAKWELPAVVEDEEQDIAIIAVEDSLEITDRNLHGEEVSETMNKGQGIVRNNLIE